MRILLIKTEFFLNGDIRDTNCLVVWVIHKNKGRKAAGTNWLTAYAKEKKQGTDASSQSKLKETIVGLSSKTNQRFSKIDPKKPSKKKVVRLK